MPDVFKIARHALGGGILMNAIVGCAGYPVSAITTLVGIALAGYLTFRWERQPR